MVDVFGKPLRQVTLADVQALLDDAEAEPLHWEAKGVAIKPGEIRKQICGFANSHDGGYLILGTEVRGGKWQLDGAEFPTEDLPVWVSNIAAGVQPSPEGLDTRVIRVGDRWIAVVGVPPTPTPPCNAHGTIYERVSGQTVSVRDPARLAQLMARGDQAHKDAQASARLACGKALAHGLLRWDAGDQVRLSVGLAAVGYAPDISSRLFAEDMVALLLNTVPGPRQLICEHRQDAVLAWAHDKPIDLGQPVWFVRAAWDGSVGMAGWLTNMERVRHQSLVEVAIKQGWATAAKVSKALGALGPVYLRIWVQGVQFDPRPGDVRHTTSGWEPGQLDRGPIGLAVDESLLPGIEREIRRHMGERVFEDPPPDIGDG